MENRFGVKDFFLFALLLVVIVLVVLSMVQVDRQWKSINELTAASNQHTHDLVSITRKINEGITVATPTGAAPMLPQTSPGSTKGPNGEIVGGVGMDPFKPIKEAETKPGFARGDWLIDNFGAKLKNITPFISTDVPAAWVQEKVQESMFYRDVDTLEFVPLLAKSWTISPDGLTFTFNLRRGVTFSDGEPFTADDVVFTFAWIRNAAVNAPRERSYLEKLDTVKKIDDYTVEFKFKEFYFKSLETIGGQLILSKKFYEPISPTDFNQSVGLLIGTGPWRLADPKGWRPGQKMELIRNERYWGDAATFDRLVYLEVEEEVAEQTMFTNGEMDIFAATAEQYDKLKDDPKVKARAIPMEYQYMLQGYSYIGWNQKIGDKPTRFADKRVRQAMTMLIDRNAIAQQVYRGYATPASGPFGPGSKQADPNIKPLPYDPARAKALLAECGYQDRDGDGVLEDEKGEPFRFKLTSISKSAVYDRITLIIKDSLARAGVVMEREPVDWPLLQTKLDRRDFDAITLAWSGVVEEDCYQIFHSSQMKDQGDNRMSYSNPELDAAIDKARTTVDPEARNQVWHRVHQILHEDQPYTFMMNRKSTVLFNNRLNNLRTSKIGTNYNRLDCSPLPWFVPQAQQKYTK